MAISREAVLLVVDVQQGFDQYNKSLHRNNPELERNIARLLDRWRATGRPVVFVQHVLQLPQSPLRPNQPGVEIMPEVRPHPGGPVVRKAGHSAFIGTSLEADLRVAGRRTLLVTGVQT